ncbi:MAG: hypothetical protein WC523_05515 [Patescibacteria group bacterium]|jgi:hypothetical protein
MKKIIIFTVVILIELAGITFLCDGVIVLTIKAYHFAPASVSYINQFVAETDGASALSFVLVGLMLIILPFAFLIIRAKEKVIKEYTEYQADNPVE